LNELKKWNFLFFYTGFTRL